MTEWTDYRVSLAEELEQRCIDRWAELWEFNGGVEPKFWFGDTAIAHRRRTLILGMQWRDGKLDAPSRHNYREGWWYSVLFEGDRGLRLIHEDCLSAIDTGEKQCPES